MDKIIKQKYDKWMKANLPDDLRKQLNAMKEEEISDAFYRDLEFGTGGMRGVMGPGTNRLNVFVIRKVTRALALYLLELSPENRKRGVVISHDNRMHSRDFTLESAKMLASFGIKAYIFDDLRPTPELSYGVRVKGAAAGIMITASHNPKEYNGFKIYDDNGCQLTPSKIKRYLDIISEQGSELDTAFGDYEPKGEVITLSKDVDNAYLKDVKSILLNNDLPKNKIKMVFTPQHGASYELAHQLFDELGYDVTYVKEQCVHDPMFGSTKSPNPEIPAAYDLAKEYAKKVNADIIMSTDPDADRCGIVIKNKKGEYELFTGNQTGAMLIDYVLSERKKKGLLHKNGVLFDTVVTSSFGRNIAKSYGLSTESLLTGFKFIGDRIYDYEISKEKTFEFGYEESYGYLLASFVRDKDSLQALSMILEMTNYYLLQGKTLDVVYEELQEKYEFHNDKLFSIYFEGQNGQKKMESIMAEMRTNPLKEVIGIKLTSYEDYKVLTRFSPDGKEIGKINLPKTDMIKYFFEDGSTIAIRPSGTEPKCKFYYGIVGKSKEEVSSKPDDMHKEILKILGI